MPLELAAYLKEQGARVDARLATILPHLPNASAKLYDAMSYSLLAGGKRLRPIFFLTVLRSFGMEAKDVDFACGLEMIHTFLRSMTTCLQWITTITVGVSLPATKRLMKLRRFWLETAC